MWGADQSSVFSWFSFEKAVGAVFFTKWAPNKEREKEQTTNDQCLGQSFIVSCHYSTAVTSTIYVVPVLSFGLSCEDRCIVIKGLIKLKIFTVYIKYGVIFCQIIFESCTLYIYLSSARFVVKTNIWPIYYWHYLQKLKFCPCHIRSNPVNCAGWQGRALAIPYMR